MRVNGVTITPETTQATRQHFADLYQRCIDEAAAGVTDLDRYVTWRREAIRASLAGEHDGSLTFLQRALYLQTRQSVAILA